VQVDAQLLLHGRLVLDHEHCGAEHLRRPEDLEAGRKRRQPDLAIFVAFPPKASVFQGLTYVILNDYWRDVNNQTQQARRILSSEPGSSWKYQGV
jgi:hypothetical protein